MSEGARERGSEGASECVCVSVMSECVSDEGGGREEGADTELKTKTPHVNVGKNNPNTTHDASLTRKASPTPRGR